MQNHEIDPEREGRLGFPEFVYGKSKKTSDLLHIIADFKKNDRNVLITKLQKKKAVKLLKVYPEAFYDKNSGVFILIPVKEHENKNEVAIISAGTSDIHIVNEAYYTLQFLGVNAKRFHDIGVAGVHRVLNKVDILRTYKILIVIAGFEGALPTLVGGLLPQPIIAVPTNVGYGVAKGGHVALNAMLSSCANGISVVNINNGYGAALSAFRILQLLK